ncbi:hypothetical protein SKAU_G00331660 [Synaphobranchus kaupii]|uniref:Uncharacterized protein n=1 Tax=Synaphobranchus kaupii TaxID=118154 RepID=A0A9Q1IHL7_SYNKA|nr:hypothetical protein SKAU_G00331660 [Synaphobranchus kaupii]
MRAENEKVLRNNPCQQRFRRSPLSRASPNSVPGRGPAGGEGQRTNSEASVTSHPKRPVYRGAKNHPPHIPDFPPSVTGHRVKAQSSV